MGCVINTIDKPVVSEELKKIMDHIHPVWEEYNRNDLMRFLMTGSGRAASRGTNDFKTWVEMVTGTRFSQLTVADAMWARAQFNGLMKATKKFTFEDDKSLSAFLMKVGTLPVDMFNHVGLGGFYEKASEADAHRELRINKAASSIKSIRSTIESISKLSLKHSEKKMAELEEAVGVAQSKFMAMSSSGKHNASQIAAARTELVRAQEKLNEFIFGKNSDPGANILGMIAKRLNGDITEAQLLGSLKKYDSQAIKGIIKDIREFTDQFVDIGKMSAENMRSIVEYELIPMFGAEEAKSMASKLVNFDVAESVDEYGKPIYYPHSNLVALYKRVENVNKVRTLASSKDRDSIRKLVEQFRTGHGVKRKGYQEGFSWNTLSVLEEYAREMYTHEHATTIGKEATRFMSELFDIKAIKDAIHSGDSRNPKVMYARSVQRLLMNYMGQVLDRKVSTFADEAIGIGSAFQVLSKLTSPSTTITNRLEGVIQYMSYNGMNRVGKLNEYRKTYGPDIKKAMDAAQVDFDSDSIIAGGLNVNNRASLAKVLAATDMQDLESLIADSATRKASAVRSGISEAASKVLKFTGWQAAENANRRTAFELGAAEAAEYVNNVWHGRFINGSYGRDIDFLRRNYNLRNDLFAKAKDGDADARSQLWEEFKTKYMVRQGYRSMFQTQFQYSRSARNFMDLDAKTGWITMFQHYPRSLASVVAWAMADAKNLYEVGGIKALTKPLSSKEGFLVNHKVQHVLTLGMISSLRHIIRASTGLVLFNVLTNPASDLLVELFDYFTDDNEELKKQKKWELVHGYEQPLRQITGPMFGDALDILSLAAVKAGIDDGSMPEWLGTTLGVSGLRLSEKALTEDGRRKYNDAFDIVREHLLWDAFAIKDKAVNLAGAIASQDAKNIIYSSANAIGLRQDYQVVKAKREKASSNY